MPYAIVNQATGKELKITEKVAREFFGLRSGIKRVMCMPFVHEDKGIDLPSMPYEFRVLEKQNQTHVDGTCVIRMGGVGDLVMLSSGLREMIDRGETITIATLPPHVDFMQRMFPENMVISVEDVGLYNFDKVIDLRWATEPPEMGTHCRGSWGDYVTKDRSDVFDELLGVYPAKKTFSVPIDNKALAKMRKIFKPYRDCRIVAVNVSIMAAARSIPVQYVEPLCRAIIKAFGTPVVIFGQSYPWNMAVKDITMNGLINLVDQTDLQEMIALCSLASVLVTPDSAPLHLGGTLGVKTLGLFGPINPRTRISYYESVSTLYPHGELPCIPCWDMHPCSSDCGASVKCMELLTPDRVVNAIKRIGGF